MKAVLKLVLLTALIALGVWLWLVLFPSPEKIIRHRLEKLAQKISFSPGEGNLARIASAESVDGYFSTNVEVNIDVPGRVQHSFWGRAEITQAALASRSAVSGLTVKFPDVNVTVMPDKQNATADLTFEATVNGQADVIVQEMRVTLQKIDGQWQITHVETVRTLSSLGHWKIETIARHPQFQL
jgi:hypothetical protein